MSDPVDRLHRRATLLVTVLWLLIGVNAVWAGVAWHYVGRMQAATGEIEQAWDAVHARCFTSWPAAVWPAPVRPGRWRQ